MKLIHVPIYSILTNAFDRDELSWIMDNTAHLELTNFCSTVCTDYCPASKKPDKALSFDSVMQLTGEFPQLARAYPYHLSNPPEYLGEHAETFVDICDLFQEKTGKVPFISVAVPKDPNKYEVIYQLWKKGHLYSDEYSDTGRISNPYVEPGRRFLHPERIEAFLNYVSQKENTDKEKIRRRMPIQSVLHYPVGGYTTTSGIIMTANGIEGNPFHTGLYFQELNNDVLDFLKYPVNKKTIREYMARGAHITNRHTMF
ncbi:MAG: hypothetical protein NDI94_04385 [Candidatus Woesearchaeota archaeon]|nr:hypothetical protein [Candidatus Woesearchaeota archaeon]